MPQFGRSYLSMTLWVRLQCAMFIYAYLMSIISLWNLIVKLNFNLFWMVTVWIWISVCTGSFTMSCYLQYWLSNIGEAYTFITMQSSNLSALNLLVYLSHVCLCCWEPFRAAVLLQDSDIVYKVHSCGYQNFTVKNTVATF